jgi:hypothetical protein
MGNLVKALKIAANVAEIIVAGSVLIEKYGGRLGKKKSATGKVATDTAATITDNTSDE